MKQVFKYILIGLSLLSVSVAAQAQYHHDNGISTKKTVSSQDGDGNYTITLETFATGTTSVVMSSAPADIVLVLDLSQSMTTNYSGHYVYTARSSQGYSYQGYDGNNTYYYKHTDGEYYAVQRGGTYSTNGNRRLWFDVNGTIWYLSGSGEATTTQPAGVGNNTTIWTGVLYSRSNASRLQALQEAVEDFVEVIYHNDNFEDDTDTKPRNTPLGNRISIVTFGGPQNNTTVTKINSGLTNVTNADGSKNASMISDLLALTNSSINGSDHYGTYADEGMVLANNVLSTIDDDRKDNSSRTVVLFTDGAPGSGPDWTTGNGSTNSIPTSNRAIAASLTAKTTHTATVFTVILGNIANTDMGHYLDYTSSNYPNAASMTNPGDPAEGDADYSLEAGNDLKGVFTQIAKASGGSERPVDSETQVRDVVSSSFVVPSNFDEDDVVVKVYKVEDFNNNVWVEDTTYDTSDIEVSITKSGDKDMLVVEGFDYSMDDNPKNSGNGNWVGERYINNQYVWKGRKLVIEFKIKSIDGSTGGDGTNTNDPASGVYVKDGDNYVCLNNYDMPHTNLPINLIIVKYGLKHGESATFEIERIRPKNWVEGDPLADNLARLEYNAIGKPIPASGNWDDWSKVIITNKGADGAAVTKKLLALDPHYIYRVAEDNWGWAYEVVGAVTGDIPNTSTVEVNPFTFTNTEKEGAVKHAEAVSINHFGYKIQTGEFAGEQEEHYKSSKVGSLNKQQ